MDNFEEFHKLYTEEFERTKKERSLRSVIIQSIIIEMLVISIFNIWLTKKGKKPDKNEIRFINALNFLYYNDILKSDEYEKITNHRNKRNWILHRSFLEKCSRRELNNKINEAHHTGKEVYEILLNVLVDDKLVGEDKL